MKHSKKIASPAALLSLKGACPQPASKFPVQTINHRRVITIRQLAEK